jgi:RNA polymerase sigma-70 factor (ECF subfamily)
MSSAPSHPLAGEIRMPGAAQSLASEEPATETAQQRLDRLFRAHHAGMWRVVRRHGNSAATAADVTQQAFLIVAERLKDIRKESEKAYLYATAIQLARTRHRREQRTADHDVELLVSAVAQTEMPGRRRDAERVLSLALQTLDQEALTVFVLFELEDNSTQEIADILGIPLGTVASRLRRAREQFRAAAATLEKQVHDRGAK